MKKITNKEEANFYFKKVNELVDDYIKNHKVKPNEIYHYINRNYDSFLEEIGLNDVEGIKMVVNNVLEHRLNMQKDKVMKFENFSLLKENVLTINKSSVEQEKVLADYFNTSLGHIENIDSEIHLYLINDFGQKKYAFIFSEEDVANFKEYILEGLLKEVEDKIISLNEVDGKEIGFSLRFWLSDVIDDGKFKDLCLEKVNTESVLKFVKSLILSKEGLPIKVNNDILRYVGEFNNHFIWVV